MQTLHLAPTAAVLLALIVGGTALKAALILLANRQVGYTVAHIATDLRLGLIRALLATRWEYYVHAPLGGFANAVALEATRAADAYLRATTILMLVLQGVVYAAIACAAVVAGDPAGAARRRRHDGAAALPRPPVAPRAGRARPSSPSRCSAG